MPHTSAPQTAVRSCAMYENATFFWWLSSWGGVRHSMPALRCGRFLCVFLLGGESLKVCSKFLQFFFCWNGWQIWRLTHTKKELKRDSPSLWFAKSRGCQQALGQVGMHRCGYGRLCSDWVAAFHVSIHLSALSATLTGADALRQRRHL